MELANDETLPFVIRGHKASSNFGVDASGRIHSKLKREKSQWEVIEGLKSGQRFVNKPEKFVGILWMKRKWPMKGWRKRYCLLEDGVLSIHKNFAESEKGRIRGSVDIGLSVISTRASDRQIDIDTEEFIYHFKVKDHESFLRWIVEVRQHRLYRQDEIAYGGRPAGSLAILEDGVAAANIKHDVAQGGSVDVRIEDAGQSHSESRIAAWLLDSVDHTLSNSQELSNAQALLFQLSALVEQLEEVAGRTSPRGETPDATPKGNRIRWSFRKHKPLKSDDKTNKTFVGGNLLAAPTPNHSGLVNSSSSPDIHNLLDVSNGVSSLNTRKISSFSNRDQAHLINQEMWLRDEFIRLAQQTRSTVRALIKSVHTERERLRLAAEKMAASLDARAPAQSTTVDAAAELLQQQAELARRLHDIHVVSDVSCSQSGEVALVSMPQLASPDVENKVADVLSAVVTHDSLFCGAALRKALDHSSISAMPAVSLFSMDSEYHDAYENMSADESGTDFEDEEDEALSEGSEDDDRKIDYSSNAAASRLVNKPRGASWSGKRERLPTPMADSSGFSLWNILTKNIGKDLSHIAMPVVVHEPLSALQVLSEDLEYAELLDQAAECTDPNYRMLLVATFAASCYASSYSRAERKPFNPLLGETFELERSDKGFRFVAEQVGHHPPAAACHAESTRGGWMWWHDARVRIKFWGKSMEVQPLGSVHVDLQKWSESYSWNKVTTCVHNILSGRRWVDQYGEVNVRCPENGITCKLVFEKTGKNTEQRHEVTGSVFDSTGTEVHAIIGKWTEGLYLGPASVPRLLWRPAALPPEHELYYGFTRFAMHLNELNPQLRARLPPTDSRLRVDQRLLEDGKIAEADHKKLELENAQRQRRKIRETSGDHFCPNWFREDTHTKLWRYNNAYWQAREQRFADVQFEPLW